MTGPAFRIRRAVCAAALIVCAVFAGIGTASAGMRDGPVHLLLVTGLGGEERYSQLFHDVAMTALDAAEQRLGLGPDGVTYLAEDPQRDPRIDGRATADAVERALVRLAQTPADEDGSESRPIVLMLIGHANGRGPDAAFNLPGPDLTGRQLAGLLEPIASRPVIAVVAAASSGPFIAALSAPGRVVVTATHSVAENNAVRFGEHFVNALTGSAADLDKDGRLSLLEAFAYARREVQREYESDKRLLTEHALLDDNGDGEGSLAPTATPGERGDAAAADGELAARVYLDLPEAKRVVASSSQALAAMRTRHDALRARIDALVARKSSLPADLYDERLEALLVDLTMNRRALQKSQSAPLQPPAGDGG